MDRNKLIEMLTLQDNFNKKVNPDWVNAEYRWSDAIMFEGVEAMEHYGQWKWWKKGNPDIEQTIMELVDIWHFIMSDTMETFSLAYRGDNFIKRSADEILAIYEEVKNQPIQNDPAFVNTMFRQIIGRAANQETVFQQFFSLLTIFNMPFGESDELYKLYIGKNALNHFRQTHGYKTGEYVKVWHDEEDNVHLMKALDILVKKNEAGSLFDRVLNELELIYKTVK